MSSKHAKVSEGNYVKDLLTGRTALVQKALPRGRYQLVDQLTKRIYEASRRDFAKSKFGMSYCPSPAFLQKHRSREQYLDQSRNVWFFVKELTLSDQGPRISKSICQVIVTLLKQNPRGLTAQEISDKLCRAPQSIGSYLWEIRKYTGAIETRKKPIPIAIDELGRFINLSDSMLRVQLSVTRSRMPSIL